MFGVVRDRQHNGLAGVNQRTNDSSVGFIDGAVKPMTRVPLATGHGDRPPA
jgi:hypothetical protein